MGPWGPIGSKTLQPSDYPVLGEKSDVRGSHNFKTGDFVR
jgi:hypothetical protein